MKLLYPLVLVSAARSGLSMIIRPYTNSSISSTSSSTPQALSLTAALQPVNQTHIKVSTRNTYRHDISILSWNSHFQSVAEHGSFRVTHKLNGTGVKLTAGEDMLRFTFTEAIPDDFVRIPTGKQHEGYYDLTKLFKVSTPGAYKVTLDLITSAFLHRNGTTIEEVLRKPRRHALHQLDIRSKPIMMNLTVSQPSLNKRADRYRPGDCNGDQTVETARNNAKDLARHAQGSGNAALWGLYFNNGDQRGTVSNAYQGVQDYDPVNKNFGVLEQCERFQSDYDCQRNQRIAAYAAGPFDDGTYNVVFCGTFFALPAQLTCDYPSSDFPSMIDQGGTFLHELMHVKTLAGVDIDDGVRRNCYNWECVTKAVTPDNGGEAPPWNIAKSYEFYAYAARALGTRECNVDEGKVTAPYNGVSKAVANVLDECEPGVGSCTFDRIAVAGTPD